MTDRSDYELDLLTVDSLIKCGELLAAYDKACLFLRDQPHSLVMRHRAVLCLARSGALEEARQEYARLGLDAVNDDEDILALGGRLLKSSALEEQEPLRSQLAVASARKYEKAYRKTGGYFPGINTATLSLIAGDGAKAIEIALEVLAALPESGNCTDEEDYYQAATRAEALLLLGKREECARHLADAIARDPLNFSARASTLGQLRMIEEAFSHDDGWLDQFRPPKAMHFAGHMFDAVGGSNADNERAIRDNVQRLIEAEDIGFGFGALAAGADIVIAETLLAAGKELHLVQPAPDDAFIATSLEPFGSEWLGRFAYCKTRAASITYISDGRLIADGLDMAFSSRVAMGHAVMRARAVGSEAVQFIVWDEKPSDFPAGTAHDAACWRQIGCRQFIHPFRRARNPAQHSASSSSGPTRAPIKRDLMAMLFLDAHGFGQLDDEGTALFVENVLQLLADRCARLAAPPCVMNTWGDGLFLAFKDIRHAAEAALALQEAFRAIDLQAIGLPEALSLRTGCHFGPVQEYLDPFLNRPNIFGRQVTIAARIEQVTLPGSIYVSEPFASILAASPDHHYRCEYVGRLTTRTKDGSMQLFSLRRTKPASRDQSSRPQALENERAGAQCVL